MLVHYGHPRGKKKNKYGAELTTQTPIKVSGRQWCAACWDTPGCTVREQEAG